MKTQTKKWTMADNDEWIRIHLEELVNKYPGEYIVASDGEIFSGKGPKILDDEARKKYPGVIPIEMPVPRPKDFLCALYEA